MSDPFAAMVLAAGFGTRLAPLTEEIPKPLAPVGETPLLLALLRDLQGQGAAELVVNVHFHAPLVRRAVRGLPWPVAVSEETRILGTAGGLKRASQLVRASRMLLVNGDIFGELPVRPLVRRHDPGLILAVSRARPGEGTVGIGVAGEVVRLRGERFGAEVRSGDYMGVACAGPACLGALPDEGCLIGDYALPLLRAGGTIGTEPVSTSFVDVGTPDEYLKANLLWLERRSSEFGENGGSYVGPGSRVDATVTLSRSLVGAGASVGGQGVVDRSVVLPGAHADAPLEGAIVLPSGKVMQTVLHSHKN